MLALLRILIVVVVAVAVVVDAVTAVAVGKFNTDINNDPCNRVTDHSNNANAK